MRNHKHPPWSTEGIETLVWEVLRALKVDEIELEVSAMFLPALIELAMQEEVMPIDLRDPAGGFGGVDLWVATVVPAVAAALGLRRTGLQLEALEAAIEEIIRRVGSPRAARQHAELIHQITAALN